MRDHRALGRPWLVEGFMYKTVQKEEHDHHPSREESQEVFPSKKVQQENQNPHTPPLMHQRPQPKAAAEQQDAGH
jgi:hypothetical protein